MITPGKSHTDLLKIAGILIVLLSGAITGMIPLISKSFRTNIRLMGWSNSYGAGIFFAAGVMHLLHEADERIDSCCDGGHCAFPYASLIAICSYLFLLFLMKVLFHQSWD